MNKGLICGVMLLFAASCTPEKMNRSQINKYVQDKKNGIKKVMEYPGGLKMETYMLRRELVYGTWKDAPKNDSLKYFMVSFSKNGQEALLQSGGLNTYTQLIENLSFKSAEFCRLIVDGKDTLQLDNSNFSNNYGTGPSNSLLLIFKAPNPHDKYELDVDEMGFNIGDNKTTFKQSDINKFNRIIIKN